MMGQVLAYGAALRGGLFDRSSNDQQKHIVRTLLNCGRKKSYLPFASSSFILYLINNVSFKPELCLFGSGYQGF